MRKFFIARTEDTNRYSLFYTDTLEQEAMLPANAVRIPRAQAIVKCRMELSRRKYTPESSSYADAEVFPAGYEGDIQSDARYILVRHIWELKGSASRPMSE